MSNIRNFLIHALGGFSPEDCAECCDCKEEMKYNEGALWTAALIKAKMESLCGKPTDEWCKEAWEFVKEIYDNALQN